MKKNTHFSTIIIGGGAAGLFAGARLQSAKTLILEKKKLPGRKLLLSGSGQCNITHSGDIAEFLSHYGKRGRFLRHALYAFDNESLQSFFTGRGITLEETESGKIFPASRNARDILNVLTHEIDTSKINIHTDEPVKDIKKQGDVFAVKTSKAEYTSDTVLITTGGKSYPSTGSEGDGYTFAESFGHRIIPLRPALASFEVKNHRLKKLSGISLPDAILTLVKNGKRHEKLQGPLLVTHEGISGPCALHISRYAEKNDTVIINFTGIQNTESLRDDINSMLKKNPSKKIKNAIELDSIPARLLEILLDECSIDADALPGEINRKKINRLITELTEFRAEIASVEGFDTAMVTAGGVDTSEINSKTMESKIIPGLFFAGEVIDFDGDTGGYNLQAAFSTAELAVREIQKRMHSIRA